MPDTEFVRRHRSGFIFLGAAALIGSFIFTVVLGGGLKDKLGSQGAMQAAFKQRRQTIKSSEQALGYRMPSDLADARNWITKRLQLVDDEEDNVMAFLKQLPIDRDNLAMFSQANNELDSLWTRSKLVGSRENADSLARSTAVLRDKVTALALRVNLCADEVQDQERDRLALITYASYALGILGIVITAIWQAYGQSRTLNRLKPQSEPRGEG
jgi:hypothetical protein